MAKPQSKTDKNAHFAIIHYAGTVSYNVTGWLEKNKDPVNDTVVDILKKSSNELLTVLWADHPGQSAPPEEAGGKKKKKGGAKTVSSVYLVQLAELMSTLHSTEPHFIRCIVPNTHKKPLEVEPPLIMHQLTCNGVLEGIRICMRGFPNRMLYPDFKARYQILGAAEIASSDDNKTGVYALMDKIEFSRDRYRLGHTKVFFRAGALAGLEEARDGIVLKLVRWMQAECFAVQCRKSFAKKRDQRELMKVIQRNFRKYMSLRNWGWFIIIQKARLQEDIVNIKVERDALVKQIEAEQGNLSQYHEKQAKMLAEKEAAEKELIVAGEKLVAMEANRQQATADKKALEGENVVIKKDIEDVELAIQKLEQEKTNRDHQIRSLNDEIANQDEVINKINKEKKHAAEISSKATEDLQVAEDKVAHLNKIKSKLQQTHDELADSLEREKRARGDVDKQRRKVEGDLKVTQESVGDLERSKKDLENTI